MQELPFDLVTNFKKSQEILKKINRIGPIAVDLEGDLRPDGRMSLIQIKHCDVGIVIFDIYQCPDILKRGLLRKLLKSKEHIKILHDCRHDSNALRGQFDIIMVNVLDTQCGYSIWKGTPRHQRSSLQEVLKLVDMRNPHKGDVKHRPGVWEQRPLPTRFLQYSAHDVEHLEAVYDKLSGHLAGEKIQLWRDWSNLNLLPFKPNPTALSFFNYLKTLSELELEQCENRIFLAQCFTNWKQQQKAVKGETLNAYVKKLVKAKKLRLYKSRQQVELYLFDTKSGRIENRIQSLEMSNHAVPPVPQSPDHNISSSVDTFATREFVERNRGGVVISEGIEFPCTSNKEISEVKVIVENTGSNPRVLRTVTVMGATGTGVFSHDLSPEGHHIPPNDICELLIRFDPTAIGVYKALLSFQFHGFVIGRYICATCGDPRLHNILKPTTPYKKKRKGDGGNKRKRNMQILYGEKVQFGVGRLPRPLGKYPCQQISNDDIENLKRLEPDFAESSVLNYKYKQTTMLAIEERRLEDDLQEYNMPTATLHKVGMYLELSIPGLAEKRPSVLRGDCIECTLGDAIFKGYVHMVQQSTVLLKFHPSFHHKHFDGSKYDIKFVYPRRTMRLLLQGLSFLNDDTSMDLHSVLFPSESEAISDPNQFNLANLAKRNLNTHQARAVNSILGRIDGNFSDKVSCNPPYIVFGPPGTGKTSTIVESVYQVSRHKPRGYNSMMKILVCAPSNTAADILLVRLAKMMNKSELFRYMAFTRNRNDVPEKVHEHCKYDDNSNGYSSPSPDDISNYQVVVATCAMAGKLYNSGIPRGHFDVVVVDECGHAWESEVVATFSFLLKKSTGLLVLAGDPMQLGPVTHSDTDLKISMLERLVARPIYTRDMERYSEFGGYDPSCITKLLQTYRCHPAIIKVPNELFYDNDLQDMSGEEARTLLSWEHLVKPNFPLIFHGVNGENEREGNSPSWFNKSEIEQVLHYVYLLTTSAKVSPSDIGIIAPYQKQVKKIKMGLDALGYDKNIMVGSCEQFQGQEKRVIIISTVRTSKELIAYDSRFHLGFVSNFKRMNVAITRAKALLVIIGSPAMLKEDMHWRRLLRHCHDNGAYTGVPFAWDDVDISENTEYGELSDALAHMQLNADDEFQEPPPYDGGETKEI